MENLASQRNKCDARYKYRSFKHNEFRILLICREVLGCRFAAATAAS